MAGEELWSGLGKRGVYLSIHFAVRLVDDVDLLAFCTRMGLVGGLRSLY